MQIRLKPFTIVKHRKNYSLRRNRITLAFFESEQSANQTAESLSPILDRLPEWRAVGMPVLLQSALEIIRQFGGTLPRRRGVA